ncbi:MAG: nuclear transport factor 2 family protein [Lachnospiraceae bacterium]|nr:nuclear transport factor 2 family protein [Lachnospiraceae bacterium]
MDEEEKITELYKDYWNYMIEKNIEGLRGLMYSDYYLYHMTGVKQPVDEFLNGLKNEIFNYYSAEHDDIIVKVYGDEATMIGKSRVVAAVYGGGKGSWRLQGDFTLRKENGNWKFTSSRASTY